MARRLCVEPHLSSEELFARYHTAHDAKEVRRWHALWLVSTACSPQEAAEIVGFAATWVRRIIRLYNAHGPDALIDGHRHNPGGASPRLSPEQRDLLAVALRQPPAEGGVWSGRKVAAWIERTTGTKTYPQLGWVYLRDLGFTLQLPRPHHWQAASAQEQQAWKKKLTQTVERIQAEHPHATVETWAQDEARLGLQPIVRRIWAPRGQRPLAQSNHKREWLYVYAFVHPHSGKSEWFVLPLVRSDVMSLVLAEFARLTGAGPTKRIVLVWDNAGWHHSGDVVVPEGIHLVPLPAHTPELQPAERVWPLLREPLANRAFEGIEPVESCISTRCQELYAQVEAIRACTYYHWWPSC